MPKNFCPPGYIGAARVLALQQDGWEFATSGVKIGGGWCGYAKKGDKWVPVCLADPDEFPEMWQESPKAETAVETPVQLSLL